MAIDGKNTDFATLAVGLHHVSYVVGDLERSIAFYEAMGLRLHDRWREAPDECARGLGVPGAAIELAQLRNFGFLLELIQYHESGIGGSPPAPNQIGSAHLAIEVTDIDAAYEALRTLGAEPVSEVQRNPVADWVQLRDPDGNLIELMELGPSAP